MSLTAHRAAAGGQFRPEVEGLRAIAILLVVAAHAGWKAFEGGFVGVDVFFVLSGYLITRLLAAELADSGRIDFLAFYARRVRRLLPGLLLTIAVASLAAIVLLPPTEQVAQWPGAVASALWSSNLYFAFRELDYFGADANQNMWLHTWSLGVEEQFYLLWPVLLLLLARAGNSRHADWTPVQMQRGLALIFGVSFAFAMFATHASPSTAFYTVPARAWQFALGALLALHHFRTATQAAPTSGSVPARPGLVAALVSWIGVAMIVGAAALFGETTPWPGWGALAPSLGATLVIAAGPRVGAGGLLSSRPLRWIGAISYSWYLWHWPVLVLGRAVIPEPGALATSALVLTSLALAWLAKRWVEDPIRFGGTRHIPPTRALAAGAAASCLLIVSIAAWKTGISTWVSSPEQQRFVAVRGDAPLLYRLGCDDWFRSSQVKACTFGNTAKPAGTLVVIGDSIGLQWYPAVAQPYLDRGWKVTAITKSACPMVDEAYFYPKIGRRYVECEQWRQRAIAFIEASSPDLVIMGSAAGYGFSAEQWKSGTDRVLSRLSAAATRVVVIQAAPTLQFDGPTCLAKADWRGRLIPMPEFGACESRRADPLKIQVAAWIESSARPYPNVATVDFGDLVCPDGVCRAALDDHIVFRDRNHLTTTFVRTLTPAVDLRVRAADPKSEL